MVCRRGRRVRLFTRRGYDWSDRYPLIVAAADALPAHATIDGEVVVCDDAGVADFARLHGHAHDGQAFLWAFDLLELDGEELPPRPLLEPRVRCAGSCGERRPAAIRGSEDLAEPLNQANRRVVPTIAQSAP